jgi:hypothetical protein
MLRVVCSDTPDELVIEKEKYKFISDGVKNYYNWLPKRGA